MTYRERREARAERLRGWADKRETAAAATFKSHEVYRGDTAFNTQPGRIPERDRVNAQADRAFQSLRKAEGMSNRADNIENQLDHAIYSDDPDAIEALKVRIAGLEAERAAINASNAAFRKAVKAAGLPKVAKWKEADFQGHHQYEDYQAANLSGNISRNRQRLERLEREAPTAETACQVCGAEVGDHSGECPAGATAIDLAGAHGALTPLDLPTELLRLQLTDYRAEQLDLLA